MGRDRWETVGLALVIPVRFACWGIGSLATGVDCYDINCVSRFLL